MTILEVPPEVADGVRTIFTTSARIASGSISACVRGIFRRKTDSDFGWTEIMPNKVQFNTAPSKGDPVILSFRNL